MIRNLASVLCLDGGAPKGTPKIGHPHTCVGLNHLTIYSIPSFHDDPSSCPLGSALLVPTRNPHPKR